MIDYKREFIKQLNEMSRHRSSVETLANVCSAIAAAFCKATKFREDEKAACEAEYMAIVKKYTKEEFSHITDMTALIVEALNIRRESFLGPILEEVGAANKLNGQFLTPIDVSTLMSEITVDKKALKHKAGEVLKISDPACGAGVTLISTAESMRMNGIPQRDIYIEGSDIDKGL